MDAEKILAQRPPISLGIFIKMIKTLPPDRISILPIERLPDNLPADIADYAPIASRGAVENLMMAANSYYLEQRLAFQKTYGDDVVAALDAAKNAGDTANTRVFKNKILKLIAMLQEARQSKTSYHSQLILSNIKHINNLLIDIRSDNASLVKAIMLLEDISPQNTVDLQRFSAAIAQLKAKLEANEQMLAEYYVLRLKILARAIVDNRRRIESQAQERGKLQEEIQVLRRELENSQALWRRAVNRRKADEEAAHLQTRLAVLIHQLKSREVAISEQDLTDWLDAIVDASLNPCARDRIGQTARDARLALYFLLDTFCVSQEESALQIAQNPFIQVEPEKAIRFVLMSEQFILAYFVNKKNEATAWLSGAAQNRSEELGRLEKDIISELRRSSHWLHRQASKLFK